MDSSETVRNPRRKEHVGREVEIKNDFYSPIRISVTRMFDRAISNSR